MNRRIAAILFVSVGLGACQGTANGPQQAVAVVPEDLLRLKAGRTAS